MNRSNDTIPEVNYENPEGYIFDKCPVCGGLIRRRYCTQSEWGYAYDDVLVCSYHCMRQMEDGDPLIHCTKKQRNGIIRAALCTILMIDNPFLSQKKATEQYGYPTTYDYLVVYGKNEIIIEKVVDLYYEGRMHLLSDGRGKNAFQAVYHGNDGKNGNAEIPTNKLADR